MKSDELKAATEHCAEYVETAEREGRYKSATHVSVILRELARLQGAQPEVTNGFVEFWVVWGPLPLLEDRQYSSIEAANKAAEWLARNHPGDSFYPAKVIAQVVSVPAPLQWSYNYTPIQGDV
jgi:hypothetical protein